MDQIRVPIELVTPAIEQFKSEYSLSVLAEKTGLCVDTFVKYLQGRSEEIDFSIADTIICAIDIQLWSKEPLASFYETVFMHKCLWCGEPFWPARNQGNNQKFCTKRCAHRARNKRYRSTVHGRAVNARNSRIDYSRHAQKRRQAMRDYYARKKLALA